MGGWVKARHSWPIIALYHDAGLVDGLSGAPSPRRQFLPCVECCGPVDREAAGGWVWLVDGDRFDEHLAVAIVDVAHVVTTHALAADDLPTARLAAETAALAAPHEEIPRLDLAAVAAAEGHHAEAQRIIRDEVCNRTDDDGPPPELSTRTEQILTQRQDWLGPKAS